MLEVRGDLYRLKLEPCHHKPLSGSSSIRSTPGHSSTCLAESSLELPAASLLEHLLLLWGVGLVVGARLGVSEAGPDPD